MQHEGGRARSLVMAPLLAIAMGAQDCSHGLRYGAAVPFDAAVDSGVAQGKLGLLAQQFVRQETDASCSVASVTTILNAVLAYRHRTPVTQQQVVAADSTGHWATATATADSQGVTLDQLGLFAMQAFYAAGIKRVGVDVNHVRDQGETTVNQLVAVLDKLETTDDDYFVIVNFLQSAYFKDGDPIGHMSAVGAFDLAHERVLVLDVDPREVRPYWVSLQQFVAGMQTSDDETGEPRGYLVIRLG